MLFVCAKFGKTRCLLPIALAFLALTACENGRYTGFSYQAQELVKTAPVSGTITNVFTGDPVDAAEVSFEGQIMLTNDQGNYLGRYFLSNDDDANRAVPVTIAADKYFVQDTTLIFLPLANVLDASLVYAAPIVISAEINDDAIATAIVFDYQGADNIDVVVAFGWYAPTDGSRVNFYHEVAMDFVRQIDVNRAEFRAELEPLDNAVLVPSRIRIRAVDNDNFEEDTLILF